MAPTKAERRLRVAVVGVGLVGSELLRQLAAHSQGPCGARGVRLELAAICTSKRMHLLPAPDARAVFATPLQAAAASARVSELLETCRAIGAPLDLDALASHLQADSQAAAALIDCTASDAVAALVPKWLQAGIHVVTPNKRAFSGPLALFEQIRALQKQALCYHEATVGAGLPVLNTLADLIDTGDRVLRIEGIFSGTLSFLFNQYCAAASVAANTPFSAIVRDAKERGYTRSLQEPDPREDLSGMDFARKVVILGRCAGLPLDLATLPVESLVPAALQSVPSADEFMARLPEHDGHYAGLRQAAAATGEVLRYVGVIDFAAGTASVGLRSASGACSYPQSHPFAALEGSANVVAFTTERYPSPLVIQGAGAGAAVTAMGVFGDLLRVVRSL